MLSKFPRFAPISIESKDSINSVVAKFPPYSDFNFVSLYSYDVKQNMGICELNNSLVVRFKDYTSDKEFLSFIGDSEVDSTIKTLLAYAAVSNLHHELHLIPEHVVNEIKNPQLFNIEEDRDAHDYIVLALKFTELKGDD